MEVDVLLRGEVGSVADEAAAGEAAGFRGVWVPEAAHDPFVAVTAAGLRTTRALVGTAVAVAFARNPMNLAVMANDLQLLSGGRFVLGLGSQVRSHVTKRFGMPWSPPVERMREMVDAIRAIWACWNDRQPLRFRGSHYRHTLMTEFFDPGPNPNGAPPIALAAVGPRMAELAGEMADAVLCHALTTVPYLREVTGPAVERGARAGGRDVAEVAVIVPVLVATGTGEAAIDGAREEARRQVAFYASTPAYRPVLEHGGEPDELGGAELHQKLRRLASRGAWDQMGAVVDDETLARFAVIGEPATAARDLVGRYQDLADRVVLYPVDAGSAAACGAVLAHLRAVLAPEQRVPDPVR